VSPGTLEVAMFHFGAHRRLGRRAGVAVASVIVLVILARHWKGKAAPHPPGTPVVVRVADSGGGERAAALRVAGSISAIKSVSLLAPRVLGSRSGVNRGGDGGGGGGGGDFNLVLLSLAKAGTKVAAGDVVAQFDSQNQVQRLDDYRDAVIQLESQLKSATAALASTVETYAQSVRSAKADWDKAIIDARMTPVQSEVDAEKAKLAVEEAAATYRQLDSETADVQESQRAQLRILALNLEQARIEQRRAEANVEKMTVRSPIGGFVVMASIVRNGEYGQVREGDQVFAGQPFVSVVDTSAMTLNGTMNQVDAARLRLGMRSTVRLDAYPDLELPGVVSGIGAMSVTSTFRASYVGETPVRVRIEGRDVRLLPDLTGSAEIVVERR
jgi:HlyD family secretion protein